MATGGLSFSKLTQGAFTSVGSSSVSKTLVPLKAATLFLIDRSEDLHTPSLHSTDTPFQSTASNNAAKTNSDTNTNTEATSASASTINPTISPTINPTIRCAASLAHRMFCTIPTHTSADDHTRSAVGMTQFPPFAQHPHQTSQPPPSSASSSSSSSSVGSPLSPLYTAFPAVAGLPLQLPLTLRYHTYTHYYTPTFVSPPLHYNVYPLIYPSLLHISPLIYPSLLHISPLITPLYFTSPLSTSHLPSHHPSLLHISPLITPLYFTSPLSSASLYTIILTSLF